MLVWICNGNNLHAQFLGFSGCILMLQIAVIRTTIYILVFPPLVRSFKGKDSHCTRTLNIEQELSFQILLPEGLKKDNQNFMQLIKKPTLQTLCM